MATDPTRLTEEHEPVVFNTRNALLRAAAHTFAEHGLKGSTVRGIAAEAGVKNTLITYYFGSKEKLWMEVVGWLLDEERNAGRMSFDPSGDLRAQFREHLRILFTHTPVQVVLAKVLSREPTSGMAQSVKAKSLPPIFKQARRYFDTVHELGIATRLSGEQMFQIFSAIKYWWLTAAFDVELVTGQSPHTKEAAEKQADLMMKLFTA